MKNNSVKISSVIFFFLFASIFTVLITNDSSERTFAIPIGSFSLIERDIFFLPLLFFYFFFNWQIFKQLIKDSKLAKSITIIVCVYLIWSLFGILNGNSFKYIGFALRQIIYLLIYFPLTYYLLNKADEIKKIKTLLLLIFFISIGLSILLSIFNYGNAGVNIRGIFFWLDDVNNTGTFIRVLVAGALYYPFFFFLSFGNFWGKLSKLVMLLSLIGLFLSFTRSYWVGTILGLLFFVIVRVAGKGKRINYKKTFSIFFIIVGLFCIAYFTLPNLVEAVVARFLSSEDLESGAISYRLIEAASFVEKINQSLLLGHGTGSTVITMSDFDHSEYIETAFSHNSYLIYLLYFGIIGTCLILFSIIRAIFYFRRRSLVCQNVNDKKNYIALGASLVALLGISLTASQITYSGGYFELGIIFSISEYLSKKNFIA